MDSVAGGSDLPQANQDGVGNKVDEVSDGDGNKRRRKMEESEEAKKVHVSAEEKKLVALRKNIRDVMDETQLDTSTIAAQREESERLARVAEQQKIIREYQRQTAVNKQFVRTQNRVLTLLNQGYKSCTDTDETAAELEANANTSANIIASEKCVSVSESTSENNTQEGVSHGSIATQDSNENTRSCDIVTIDDSSSEDDCIVLSDDEDSIETIGEDDPTNSGLHVNDTYNVPDEFGRVIVNIGHPEDEEDIFLAPQIAAIIKPHQIGGVRFLFDNVIESTKRFVSSSGFGCILSHSMGLGKTLQLVSFCDIFLRHTPSKTILCVMPINTLQNWMAEFDMWLPTQSANLETKRPRNFKVFVLNDQQKTLHARTKVILQWYEEGGVLLIGYELFRLLSQKVLPSRKRRSNKSMSYDHHAETNKYNLDKVHNALLKPGPDLVVCDEGHRIKNSHAGISLALKQIRTRRRIVLTGYPLQNNLLEYWCMVDFVRPNYLGTRIEFCNMFERPIQNGQCIDSTPEDIKLMRYRAHVLHSLLVGFVQRRSHVVLQQSLPQKLEYVILTRMSSFQRLLYDKFMNDIVRTKLVPNPLKAFAVCCKIWNHPDILYNFVKKREIDLDIDVEENDTPETARNESKKDADSIKLKNDHESTLTATTTSSKPENISSHPPHTTSSAVHNSQPSIYDWEKCYMENKSFDTSRFNAPAPATASYYANSCFPNYRMESNFWPENAENFYNSQDTSNGQTAATTPNFVGILSKGCSSEQSPQPSNGINSSEIVDLDTKEIKTLKTNIDMTDYSALKFSNSNLKPTNNLGTEKASSKVKNDENLMHDWAIDLLTNYEPGHISNSPKMEIFFCILEESIKIGDRVLLFSQSLLTLNLIETFLTATLMPNSSSKWERNNSYFRLDGSTTALERERLVNEFNSNTDVKLFLISTRAGSLGINLVGANRVVVFDASWNPCHDTQAIYRIYRYGQRKGCFIYRIVMDNCLEKKIYDRQIKKQAMADRVVDECNPDAHLSLKDVSNLCHDFNEENQNISSTEPFPTSIDSFLDCIVQKILVRLKSCLSKEPFYHESLLIDRKETQLSQAEKRQAHRGYELEKRASTKQNFNYNGNKIYSTTMYNNKTIKPTASVRPIQNDNSLTPKKNSGIRTTRWIPADVWQKQGMTAQEMTLPLDVVIPTNSKDKSNIILKAGQRVMVLKSVKGIYMQLENGKIIAIRTSPKPNEDDKALNNDVIDITSDEENASADTKKNEKQTHEKGENGGKQDVYQTNKISEDQNGSQVPTQQLNYSQPTILKHEIVDKSSSTCNEKITFTNSDTAANSYIKPQPLSKEHYAKPNFAPHDYLTHPPDNSAYGSYCYPTVFSNPTLANNLPANTLQNQWPSPLTDTFPKDMYNSYYYPATSETSKY